jgi:hypothetical protein
MKLTAAAAIAAAFSMQIGSMQVAVANTTTASFRTAAPSSFSADDLARFNLDPATAAKVEQHRKAGHAVMAMTPEELEAAKAGQASTTWIVLGVLALVVVVAVAAGGSGGGSGSDGGGIY